MHSSWTFYFLSSKIIVTTHEYFSQCKWLFASNFDPLSGNDNRDQLHDFIWFTLERTDFFLFFFLQSSTEYNEMVYSSTSFTCFDQFRNYIWKYSY